MAGLGGGILLLLGLSVVWGPAVALATTAPAMLLGNLHRVWMLRTEVDRSIAKGFAWGAIPGSFAGGLLVTKTPDVVLRWLMLVMTAFAMGRALKLYDWRPRAWAMVPAGAGIGAISAAVGGAGLLVGPLFLSAGLTGKRFVATIAAAAVALHVGRVVAYGLGGLMTSETLLRGGVLTVSLIGGNFVGLALRDRYLNEVRARRLEFGALLVCVGLSVFGVGKG
jgi:uncharacterized membrane protein YfcA